MKNIVIKKLRLINFKGIKNMSIDFENQTDILGANGTGKTTIADAFTWLIFGKDTTDRKDFEIKTLDNYGKVIPMIDHEVFAELYIDNELTTVRRVLKESWVKKKGSEHREFTGNVTELYWNEVPLSVTEFSKRVNEVLNEQVFKMITSPTYFNSIKWQDRRNLLIDIFGEVSNEDVAKGNDAFEKLLLKLTQGKTLEDYKNQIAASIKKAKEDLKNIPSRIDEVFRGKPETQDFTALEGQLSSYQTDLEKIDGEISDANTALQSKLDSQKDSKIKANNIKADIETIERNARKQVEESQKVDTSVLDSLNIQLDSKEKELTSYKNASQTLADKHTGLINQLADIDKKIEGKRTEWNTENAKEISFEESNFCCPTCKRDFEASDIDAKKAEMTENFKTEKQGLLRLITRQGQSLGTEKTNIQAEIDVLKERIETGKTTTATCESELKEIKDKIEVEKSKLSTTEEKPSPDLVYESILSMNADYKKLKDDLKIIESSIVEIPSVDNSELVEKRKGIVVDIDRIKAKLQTKTQIEAADKRIQELEQEEKTLSQQIANVEKEQFVIDNFIKAKVDALENVVNSKFKYVKFKMFDEQINGGLRETCEAMVNGVPYSDVNTASRINAGLDIINVLSQFYGISAPIFIDNAESVHTLIETNSQLIRLVVSEETKKLTVKQKELQLQN
jgi:DNA repair protein SbcC/Rad50